MLSVFRDYTLPLLLAVAMHAALIAALLSGISFERHQTVAIKPSMIKATVVALPKPQVKKAAPPKPVQKKPVPKKPAVDKAAAKKKAEAERKKAAEKKRLEEKKRKQQREKEEKLAREEQERRDREARESQLASMIDEEEELLAAEAEAAQFASLAQQYVAEMQAAIIRNWSRPPSARRDMEVILSIQLVPNGDVVNVVVEKSSGNIAFDRSAELAVQKVGRFDGLRGMPSRLFESQFRQVRLRFKPEDLRR